MSELVRVQTLHDGAIVELLLANGRGNVLDARLMQDLERSLRELPRQGALRTILLRAEGPHFCFGASVSEHRPAEIGSALARLDAVLHALAAAPAPTIACVQGLCLGGGFELVLACDGILAADDAEFGCPEIELGVFPPAAAALLRLHLPANEAARLVLTGRRLPAPRACELGLVLEMYGHNELAAASLRWTQRELLDKSAFALRQAAQAARGPLLELLRREWPRLRRQYLEELMRGEDPIEGVESFLAKRAPKWRHR